MCCVCLCASLAEWPRHAINCGWVVCGDPLQTPLHVCLSLVWHLHAQWNWNTTKTTSNSAVDKSEKKGHVCACLAVIGWLPRLNAFTFSFPCDATILRDFLEIFTCWQVLVTSQDDSSHKVWNVPWRIIRFICFVSKFTKFVRLVKAQAKGASYHSNTSCCWGTFRAIYFWRQIVTRNKTWLALPLIIKPRCNWSVGFWLMPEESRLIECIYFYQNGS